MEGTKDVALVLSSGGPRGFAYIGAIEELESRGYNITSVAGCSIGSLVGGIYAAGGLEDFKKWLFKLNNAKLMSLLDVSLSKSYLMKGEKVIAAIKEVVPEVNIEDLRIPYAAVASDLYTGEEVVFREGKLFNAIRASISIPSLFRPVQYGRHKLIDGGAVNTAPFSIVHRNGHDILVSFDVNRLDSKKIADNLEQLENIRKTESHVNLSELIGEIRRHKTDSILDFVKIAGDQTIRAYEKNREADGGNPQSALFRHPGKVHRHAGHRLQGIRGCSGWTVLHRRSRRPGSPVLPPLRQAPADLVPQESKHALAHP